MNEAYRAPSAVEPAASAEAPKLKPREEDFEPAPARRPGHATWGADSPNTLPESN